LIQYFSFVSAAVLKNNMLARNVCKIFTWRLTSSFPTQTSFTRFVQSITII